MFKPVLSICIYLIASFSLYSQDNNSGWVDSVFNKMSRNEKIAQLFMVPVSAYSEKEVEDTYFKIKNYGIGGLYISKGGPISVANMINQLQKGSKVPVIIGISAEWGLAQTLDSIISFPKPLISATWENDDSRVAWERAIAEQLKILGVQINFAPSIDTKIEEDNFLAGFGKDNGQIAEMALKFLNVMREENVVGVAKTNHKISSDTSSNKVLNVLLKSNAGGIMVSQDLSSYQNRTNLSSKIETSALQKQRANFEGLNFFRIQNSGERQNKLYRLELSALSEGNDVIITPNEKLKRSIRKIGIKIKSDKEFANQIDESVKKVLRVKFQSGLSKKDTESKSNLLQRLNNPSFKALSLQLYQNSVAVSKNENNLLPILSLTDHSFASLSIGAPGTNEFSKYLNKYVAVEDLNYSSIKDTVEFDKISADIVFVSLLPSVTKLEKELEQGLNRLCIKKSVVLVHFGYPRFQGKFQNASAEIVAYENDSIMGSIVPQLIFGAIPATARLPIISKNLGKVESIKTKSLDRLGFSLPENVGVSSTELEKIKLIMREAIDSSATPGCQVLVAKNGKIIFNHSMGYLTYDNVVPVTDETIYDLASVTKVTATLQCVMTLVQNETLDINKKASQYLPELLDTNKKDITIKDILTHQAGLWPYLPFWKQTMSGDSLLKEYYSSAPSLEYPLPVSKNLWAIKSMKDSLWKWTLNSKMREKRIHRPYDYTYSDMGFYIMHHIVEKLMNTPMQEFLTKNIYAPIGATTTGYQPLLKFRSERIAPTENDTLFRKSLLQGYVHDQGAAMAGGIAGHAGLFSTSNDLIKLGQMWLQKGSYGGKQFLKPEVLDIFTSYQFPDSRRGLGWDKPASLGWLGPTANFASPKTFGHTGFTGTCIWVDPEFDLVFVFLSNRVNTNMYNNTLIDRNIRTRIQDIIYRSIFEQTSLTLCK